MTRRVGLACAAASLLALCGCAGACGPSPKETETEAPPSAQRQAPPADAPPPAPADQDAASSGDADSEIPLRRESVRLYFPSATDDGLVEEAREILRTATPGDRAKQILSDLIEGPSNQAAVSFIPAGTKLRQVFVVNRTAYLDFSSELRSGIDGGSDAELLTVYSIVNSVVLNVREIASVGILVEGRPLDTLNGHLDLSRPLKANQKLIFDTRPDAGAKEGTSVVSSSLPARSGA